MSYKMIKLRRGFYDIEQFFNLCLYYRHIICGGYARYCASPLPTSDVPVPHDVDMFPRDDDGSQEKLLEQLYNMGYVVGHENNVSVTLKPSEDKKEELRFYPIPQIIKPSNDGKMITTGNIETILDFFDFTVVRAAIVSPDQVLVDEQFEEDELNKRLRLTSITCPISSVFRIIKYVKKGYWIRPFEVLKLFMDWSEREPEYRSRIIELFEKSQQITGEDGQEEGLSQEEIDELEALLKVD